MLSNLGKKNAKIFSKIREWCVSIEPLIDSIGEVALELNLYGFNVAMTLCFIGFVLIVAVYMHELKGLETYSL